VLVDAPMISDGAYVTRLSERTGQTVPIVDGLAELVRAEQAMIAEQPVERARLTRVQRGPTLSEHSITKAARLTV
jgi:hypothetical protein